MRQAHHCRWHCAAGSTSYGHISMLVHASFEETVNIARELDLVVEAPRRCNRQTLRNNAPATSVTEYYQRNVTIPLLDHLDQQLNDRFSSTQQSAVQAMYIVPSILLKSTTDTKVLTEQLTTSYGTDLPEPRSLETELQMWERKWRTWKGDNVPSSPRETLPFADEQFFPNIRCALRLVSTIPVTSCENERSFSSLRRIKTWLRSTMTNERLNGLALMNIHYAMPIDVANVIDTFARNNTRRMQFVDILTG